MCSKLLFFTPQYPSPPNLYLTHREVTWVEVTTKYRICCPQSAYFSRKHDRVAALTSTSLNHPTSLDRFICSRNFRLAYWYTTGFKLWGQGFSNHPFSMTALLFTLPFSSSMFTNFLPMLLGSPHMIYFSHCHSFCFHPLLFTLITIAWAVIFRATFRAEPIELHSRVLHQLYCNNISTLQLVPIW